MRILHVRSALAAVLAVGIESFGPTRPGGTLAN